MKFIKETFTLLVMFRILVWVEGPYPQRSTEFCFITDETV